MKISLINAEHHHLANKLTYAVAIEDGETIGIVSLKVVGRFGFINDLFVSPMHRRRGIGMSIVNRLVDECCRRDLRGVNAAIDHDNTESTGLFSRAGFSRMYDYPDEQIAIWNFLFDNGAE